MNLIGTAEIAVMLGLGQRHVTNIITKRADFPAPMLVLSRRTVRWERADVAQWIQKQRDTAARFGQRSRSRA